MRLWMIAVLAAGYSCCFGQTIELSTSSFASLYGYLRASQAPGMRLPAGKLGDAVNDLAKVESTFPDEIRTRTGIVITSEDGNKDQVNGLYWRTIDAFVYSAASIDELKALRGQLPPKIGGHLDTAQTINTIIGALQKSQAPYEAQVWPRDRANVEAQLAYWKESVGMKGNDALKWIAATLGIKNTPNWVDVVVVPDAGGKEGMTVRRPEGLRVIVGAGKFEKADFAEVILHEATHVLDATSPKEGMLADLRTALDTAKRSDLQIEQAPHTVMFLLAAEATRKFVNPMHIDVGESYGIYARGLAPFRKAEAPEIEKLVKGEQTREKTIAAIVAGL